MLLVLKIPIVYLSIVVWTAIRAEPPLPEGPGELEPVGGHPPPAPERPPRARARRRLDPRGASRSSSPRRPAPARAEVRG